eukprot:403343062
MDQIKKENFNDIGPQNLDKSNKQEVDSQREKEEALERIRKKISEEQERKLQVKIQEDFEKRNNILDKKIVNHLDLEKHEEDLKLRKLKTQEEYEYKKQLKQEEQNRFKLEKSLAILTQKDEAQKSSKIQQNLQNNKQIQQKEEGIEESSQNQIQKERQFSQIVSIRQDDDESNMEKLPQIDETLLSKIRNKQAITTQEMKDFQRYEYDMELYNLQNKPLNAPSRSKFLMIKELTNNKKYECLTVTYCPGKFNNYLDGVFDKCGKMNPFIIWDKFVNEKAMQKDIEKFQRFYDIPLFEAPNQATIGLNSFFQAKYGMFYCSTTLGGPDFDPLLIQQYEKNEKQLKKTWSLAVMSTISDGYLKWEDIEKYRKQFKFRKNYKIDYRSPFITQKKPGQN